MGYNAGMKKIALFGSTGSIGTSTLKVVSHLPLDFKVVALTAHGNIDLLEEQIREFQPEIVAVFDEKKAQKLKERRLPVKIVAGREGLVEVASLPEVEMVVMGISGLEAMAPTLAAIERGKSIALATKEVLVSGGAWIKEKVRHHQATLLPVDSEHSTLFQCLANEKMGSVERLILTSSGGPFRNFSKESLECVSVAEALNHPTWKMGAKITVDSSTLMNKALEVIEAQVLFELPLEKIEVVIHPQSIVHSLVEFQDGSIKAVLSRPDMVYAIQYALTYPERKKTFLAPFDFTKAFSLDFSPPDGDKFPALGLAYEALRVGGSVPGYLNVANEILVERFLQHEISWKGIIGRLEKLLLRHQPIKIDGLESIAFIDQLARAEARQA